MAFIRRERGPVRFYTSDAMGDVIHGFSTRVGGVSGAPFDTLNLGAGSGVRQDGGQPDSRENVLENYARFTSAVGVDTESLVFSKQVHGDVICAAGPEHRGNGFSHPSVWECDALVTNTPGLSLTIFWADCVPVLLYDPVRRAIGAAHAGWRGTVLDIVGKTVAEMSAHYKSDPRDLLAAVGPCIGRCCFETGGDVPEALFSAFGGENMTPFVKRRQDGAFHVDLPGINAWLLARSGVGTVDVAGLCTLCGESEFFSHRSTGFARGTQAAVISLGGAAS